MYHTKFHRLFAMSCVMVFSMVVLCISGCHVELYEKYETSDVDEYGVYQGHIEMEDTGLFSPLLVFPEKIADSAQDVEYYYRCACDALDNTYEVYLKCTYDKDTYEDEVKRLSQIRTTEGKVEKYIAYTEERFVYPAYVAIYDDYDCYEYALVNAEKNQFVYVYDQIKNLEDFLDSQYIPVDYDWTAKASSGFNIYDE